MAYTLAGDRGVEFNWARSNLPRGGSGKVLLDIGPGPRAEMSRYALSLGYKVIAFDLLDVNCSHANYEFHKMNFLRYRRPKGFKVDYIYNVSSIEHFGLAGRYGVEENVTNADLQAMERLLGWMHKDTKMIVTLPLGIDTIVRPWHRVYGKKRLPRLFKGYEVVAQQYWAKSGGVDKFHSVTQGTALGTVPIEGDLRYYAIGGFVLAKAVL